MKKIKQMLVIIMMILPLSALAHGEDVLLVAFAQIIAFVILLIVLIFLKFEPFGKLLLFLTYIAVSFATFYFFNFTYGEFLKNKYNISLGLTIPPFVAAVIVYLIFKSKYRTLN